jgi:hypothetical protein
MSLCMICLSVFAVALLMRPYLHYSALYGLVRSRDEIATMLPRWQSYLFADPSMIWGGFSARLGPGVPMRHEHQMFFGLGASGLAMLGLARSPQRVRWVAFASLFLLVLLTLSFRDHSIYLWFTGLPGVDSIRAVSRIGLVMVLPVAFLCATAIDQVRRDAVWVKALAMFLVVACVAETMSVVAYHTPIAEARDRVAALYRALPAHVDSGAWIFNPVRQDEPFYLAELDGVVLAQELGRPSLNGYSGSIPPGYFPHPTLRPCVQAMMRLQSANSFLAAKGGETVSYPSPSALIVLGEASPCATPALGRAADVDNDFASVALTIGAAVQHRDGWRVPVTIHNDSSHILLPTMGQWPLRLSWQVLAPGQRPSAGAWSTRLDVEAAGAIAAGDSGTVDVIVAAPAGEADLWVTAVLEGRAWLYDRGVPPAHARLPATSASPSAVRGN